MAVTVNANGSSITLNKCLKIFSLSFEQNSNYFYKIYRILILFVTTFIYVAGVYFKLEECTISTVILRYIDLFLHQIRYILNVIDIILPLFARDYLLYLTELLDASEISYKKTIFAHAFLNYCLIIFQMALYISSVCYKSNYCNILCMLPNCISNTLLCVGSFRCLCILILLKQRVVEVSEDLNKKLTENISVHLRQVDELLRGVHAFGRCFGIQLALQFVNLEGVVVYDVVMVKKVPVVIPLNLHLLLAGTTFISGAG